MQYCYQGHRSQTHSVLQRPDLHLTPALASLARPHRRPQATSVGHYSPASTYQSCASCQCCRSPSPHPEADQCGIYAWASPDYVSVYLLTLDSFQKKKVRPWHDAASDRWQDDDDHHPALRPNRHHTPPLARCGKA